MGAHGGDGLGAPDDGLGGGVRGAQGAVGRHVNALRFAELAQLVVAPEGVDLHLHTPNLVFSMPACHLLPNEPPTARLEG